MFNYCLELDWKNQDISKTWLYIFFIFLILLFSSFSNYCFSTLAIVFGLLSTYLAFSFDVFCCFLGYVLPAFSPDRRRQTSASSAADSSKFRPTFRPSRCASFSLVPYSRLLVAHISFFRNLFHVFIPFLYDFRPFRHAFFWSIKESLSSRLLLTNHNVRPMGKQ